jgi:carboxypeptidase PM20D1
MWFMLTRKGGVPMKRSLSVVIAGIMLLIAVILIQTLRATSKQIEVDAISQTDLNQKLVAEHLAKALQFRTISYQDSEQWEEENFLGLHMYLKEAFPKVHATLKKEVVADYSLLYTWEGSDPGATPILLSAHLDVVPIETGTEGDWSYPPFGGHIAEGYIWGRGALDVKVGVVGILEAVETLLESGFQPECTMYLAFGHDEESGGTRGAAGIAALLHSRGITVEYVLEEGLLITDGILPGIPGPVALIGIAEKGKAIIELTVMSDEYGGHASMPPQHNAIGILSAAIYNLEQHQPLPRIEGSVRQMFGYVGPEMSFLQRMAFANLWCFGGLIERQLAASRGTNALIRSTVAATMLNAGVEEDVLPIRARALVNVRILPGDSTDGIADHISRTIDDPRVAIRLLKDKAWEPSAVSDIESPSFAMFQLTIHQVFPEAVVAPSLVNVRTDARHYATLSRNIYRFVPVRVTADDIKRIHNSNERISIEDYEEVVRFYMQLICNSSATTPSGRGL